MSSTSSAEQADTGTKSGSWRVRDYVDLGIIGATHGLSDAYSRLLVPCLALIVADLRLSAFEAGVLLASFNGGTFLFYYPLSLAADHSGRRKAILIGGMGIAGLSFVGLIWTPGFFGLNVLAFLAGAGNASYHPCGTAMTAERFADRRAVALSFHGLMGNVGMGLMPIAQSAIAVAAGWRAAVASCVLPAVALLPLVAARFPRTGTRANSGGGESVRSSLSQLTGRVLENRNVVLLAVVYALKGIGSTGVIGFLPLLATDRFDMDTAAIGVAVSLYFGGGIVAKPLMGYLYNRWGARAALLLPILISGVLALAIGVTPWAITLLPLVALAGLSGPISPIILTAAADLCDRRALASSVGFIYTCHGLGFLSPLVGGVLAEVFSIEWSYVFFSAVTLAAAAVALGLPARRPPAA